MNDEELVLEEDVDEADEEDEEDEDEDEEDEDEEDEEDEDEDEDEEDDTDTDTVFGAAHADTESEYEPDTPTVITVAALKLSRLIEDRFQGSGRAFARAHGLNHSEVNLMRRGARYRILVATAVRMEQITNGYISVHDWVTRG